MTTSSKVFLLLSSLSTILLGVDAEVIAGYKPAYQVTDHVSAIHLFAMAWRDISCDFLLKGGNLTHDSLGLLSLGSGRY